MIVYLHYAAFEMYAPYNPDKMLLSGDEMHFREGRGLTDSLCTSPVKLTAPGKSAKIIE
ncbi:MAG: hypothetical protein AB9903_05455 [Vulcanimicrobiota bacterium]